MSVEINILLHKKMAIFTAKLICRNLTALVTILKKLAYLANIFSIFVDNAE
jgi:hypothetical protein